MTLLEVLKTARADMQVDILRDRDGVLRAVKQYAASPMEAKRLTMRVNTAFDTGAIGALAAAGDKNRCRQQAADALAKGSSFPQSVAEETVDAFVRAAWQFTPPAKQPAQPKAQPKPQPKPQPRPQPKPQPKPQTPKSYPPDPQTSRPGWGLRRGPSTSASPSTAASPSTSKSKSPSPSARPSGRPSAPPAQTQAQTPAAVRPYIATRSQKAQTLYGQVMSGAPASSVGIRRYHAILAMFIAAQVLCAILIWMMDLEKITAMSLVGVYWIALTVLDAVVLAFQLSMTTAGRVVLTAAFISLQQILVLLLESKGLYMGAMRYIFAIGVAVAADIALIRARP